jgi:hypothetical protein
MVYAPLQLLAVIAQESASCIDEMVIDSDIVARIS